MESLSDVMKQLPGRLRQGEQAEELYRSLLAHPAVQAFLTKQGPFQEQEIRLNQNRLYQYQREYDQCMNCPGLDRCPNDFQGHYTKLSVQTIQERKVIVDHKVSCKKMRAKQAQQSIHGRIRSFYVDDRALEQGYSPKEILQRDWERSESVEHILQYIYQTKQEGLQARGMYVQGSFGTGKTFLMCYLLYELAKDGHSGVIVYMPDFVEDLKSMFQDNQRLKDTIDLLKQTDLLIFDDIGAENMSPWVRDHVLGSILNYRMDRKPTFFTSNYSLEALEKHLSFTDKEGENDAKGKRLMERIRHYVDVLTVKGKNHREKNE
ncbi:primosomal protein DnaI [Marinicrinis sediminis]|uniref:Primosomal protein DnaI n=1 Tax=Marinicrinis sediminis TaxID=1652465 RepID=A0ABW5R6K8_9BACL